MELTKLGGSDDPLEGTNVTLLCRQSSIKSGTPAVTWFIINSKSKERVMLNATNLPEGLKHYTINTGQKLKDR